MNKDTSQYKVISTRECLEYIKEHGLAIDDESAYTIKSSSGLVYILPTNEVVLIPTNFDLDYPGIIFKDLEAFKYYAALDFFPIGKENMTWFERYNGQLPNFRTKADFYTKILKEKANIFLPFSDEEGIKSAFIKIQSILGKSIRGNFSVEQVDLVCSFGLAVVNYLIDKKGYQLVFRRGYENYNPTTDVLLKKDGEIKDIIGTCLIFLNVYNSNALRAFINSTLGHTSNP